MVQRLFYIALLILLSFGMSVGQAFKFTSSVSKSQVALGERFQLEFTANGKTSNFIPPSLKSFNILSGPNQSTSMQYINGNYSQSITYSYTLSAPRLGKYTIASAVINSGGKNYKSNQIQVNVVKGKGNQVAKRQQNKKANAQNVSSKNLFLEAKVGRTSVYQGEQIPVTYTIYFRVDIVRNEVSKLPDFNGFWTQDVKMPQQAKVYTANIDGVRYQAADLKKTILFPQRSGKLEVGLMEFKCVVRTRSQGRRSIFDGFFGGYKDEEYIVTSLPIKINVKPLPEKGKPNDFNGAVGNFRFNSSIDKDELKANDAVNLTVKISGTGNLKLIAPMDFQLPPDIDRFDPKIVDNITTNSNGVSGSKTFEYLLIPRHAGEFKIPPISFSYFDPMKKHYKTLSSPEYILKVAKGDEETTTILSTINKENVKFIGSDIMFIKKLPFVLHEQGKKFFLTPAFFTAACSPIILLFLGLFIRRRSIEQSSNIVLVKRKRARKLARKRLASAKKHMAGNQRSPFYEEILKGLWGYVSDKLNVRVADLSKESIRSSLLNRQVSESTIEELTIVLDKCEFAQYAPAGAEGEMTEVYQQSLNLIGKIESEIT